MNEKYQTVRSQLRTCLYDLPALPGPGVPTGYYRLISRPRTISPFLCGPGHGFVPAWLRSACSAAFGPLPQLANLDKE